MKRSLMWMAAVVVCLSIAFAQQTTCPNPKVVSVTATSGVVSGHLQSSSGVVPPGPIPMAIFNAAMDACDADMEAKIEATLIANAGYCDCSIPCVQSIEISQNACQGTFGSSCVPGTSITLAGQTVNTLDCTVTDHSTITITCKEPSELILAYTDFRSRLPSTFTSGLNIVDSVLAWLNSV